MKWEKKSNLFLPHKEVFKMAWESELSGGFAGQPWVKWVAFIILLMTILFFWDWVLEKVFD